MCSYCTHGGVRVYCMYTTQNHTRIVCRYTDVGWLCAAMVWIVTHRFVAALSQYGVVQQPPACRFRSAVLNLLSVPNTLYSMRHTKHTIFPSCSRGTSCAPRHGPFADVSFCGSALAYLLLYYIVCLLACLIACWPVCLGACFPCVFARVAVRWGRTCWTVHISPHFTRPCIPPACTGADVRRKLDELAVRWKMKDPGRADETTQYSSVPLMSMQGEDVDDQVKLVYVLCFITIVSCVGCC